MTLDLVKHKIKGQFFVWVRSGRGVFLLSALGICGILDERKEAMEMKILFINLPYHGHVIPTIGLVQELIKAGHQVTYGKHLLVH